MQKNDPHHDHAPDALSRPSVGPEKLPGIRHVIAVASGKGGVGKFTSASISRSHFSNSAVASGCVTRTSWARASP